MPRRATLAIAVAGLALAALVVAVLWLLDNGAPDGAPGAVNVTLLVTAGSVLGVAIVCTLLWAFLALKVFHPLLATVREAALGRAAMAEAGLDPLARDIAALAGHLGAARGTATALETARAADPTRRRLEAILRDLSEGVVVCNREHQVLLYNRVALWLLSGAGEVGLGRRLFEAAEEGQVRDALETLLETRELEADAAVRDTASLTCTLRDGTRLDARMALIGDASGEPEGYVLTLAGAAATDELPAPAPRPEFYDFDLFSRPAPSAATGATPLRDLTFVVFDTETTGLRPAQGDGMVALAAVRVRGGRVLSGETYETLIDPERPIPASATRIHGITDATVAGAPPAEAVLPAFRRFVGDAVLVAHNAAFDMAFVSRKAAACDTRFDMPVLDTLLLSVALHDHATDHTLDGIAARLDVALPPERRHTALGDALATAHVLVRLVDLLIARGTSTLEEALAISARQTELRRQQAQF